MIAILQVLPAINSELPFRMAVKIFIVRVIFNTNGSERATEVRVISNATIVQAEILTSSESFSPEITCKNPITTTTTTTYPMTI